MTLQRTKIADIQYVASSVGAIYSNPASTKTFIRAIMLFNGNTATEVVKVYNVPDSSGSAGTASGANQFLEYSLATKETLEVVFEYPIVLTDTADTLQAATTTASKVTVTISGDVDS